MVSFSLSSASPAKTRADAVVVGVHQTPRGVSLAPGADEVKTAYGRRLGALLTGLGVGGKVGEVTVVPTNAAIRAPLLVMVGLGEAGSDPVPAVRRAAGVAARATTTAGTVALALPADSAELVAAAVLGYRLGGYTFTDFKSSPPAGSATTDVLVLTAQARQQPFIDAADRAERIATATGTVRDWVNTPPGALGPPEFAEAVRTAHRQATKGRGAPKLTLTVHDDESLAALGCGGILGVGQGSAKESRLVELSYAPPGADLHLALVGKGVTFDSGGLTIKPAQAMTTMKCDMAGAATVIQATLVIAALGLPVRVSTFAPMAENMVSGAALRPGDVLTMYGGRTVEVLNTDAEGRLLLADGLGRAVAAEPDVIIDVATLTGAMIIALGDKMAGAMGSPDQVAALVEAGARAGETIWPMPIPDDIVERVRSSKIADVLQHDWGRWGGGLYAGAFLQEFTGDRPWVHLDIAGPAYNDGAATGHLTPGGTGFGVATLVEFAESMTR